MGKLHCKKDLGLRLLGGFQGKLSSSRYVWFCCRLELSRTESFLPTDKSFSEPSAIKTP